jgi:predicted CoA-substrate-specific enzyme activase
MENGKYFAGIDIGSLSVETVIIDHKKKIITYNILPTGANSETAGEKSFKDALQKADLKKEQIKYIIATGYGRISIPFANKKITEISCHGKGAHYFFPNTKTIIDIGGQDSKGIQIDSNGKVQDFLMNDKCAAGTGRFLEVMARTLELNIDSLGKIGLESQKDINISSMCTVFAESEVVSLIAKGENKEDIVKGLHNSISQRVVNMVRQLISDGEITMTGGVAKNIGMVSALERKLKMKLNIPDEPQIIGALGAALFAMESSEK